MTGEYFINDTNIWDSYGMFIPIGKDFYAQLLKAPIRKEGLTKNWPEQNGIQRNFYNIKYEDRALDLPFVMYATNKLQLLEQYNALSAFVFANQSITLKCVEIDRLFTLKYKAMPTFNKLTTFEDNDRIAVEFSISFIDEYPTVFKKADGSVLTMTFPPDVPDVPIDFNDYGFEIVGGNLYMSGEGLSSDAVMINGNEIDTAYNLYLDKGFHNELLKLPESKKDVPLKFESRTLELPFYLKADSDVDFFFRYYSLVAFFLQSRHFTLDVNSLNKRFTLCYAGMSGFDTLSLIIGAEMVVAGLKITCYDDYPTVEGGLSIYNGYFDISGDGDLIFTQSDEFDDNISFELTEHKDLLVIRP